MTAPVYDFLENLSKKNPYPFHMPGHKRQKLYEMPLFDFDITEIDGADNLHKSEGIIKQAQQLMAKTVGAKESFFIVNGSSCAIMASIMSVCREGDKILVARNCHRSVYNGIVLSGAIPVYIYPKVLENGLIGAISPKDVEYTLTQYNDIKALVITSPTYEGFCSDIKKIGDMLHEKNIPIIVDEAHGAHFGFYDYFPADALSQGADVVIQSWHKTLPVLTQCSVAHIGSDLVDRDKFFSYISMLQTSSPSYIFMSAIDKCREILENNGSELFKNYTQNLACLRKDLLNLKKIKLIDSEILNKAEITDFDKGKLVFEINSSINGNMLENILIKDYNFQIEMSGLKHIILMTSVMDTMESYEKLSNAMFEINSRLSYNKNTINTDIKAEIAIAKISPKTAFNMSKKNVSLDKAENQICGDFIIPYPPGIPILAPGELISKNDIIKIKKMHDSGIKIIGINNNEICICLKK